MKKNQTSILTSTNIIVSAVNKAISKAQTGITTAASPLKTSNTTAKQSASVRPTTVPAAYSAGRNVVDAQSVSKTLNDARLLNEQKQREVQAVQQLPKDFPIENWEKMPVKAQLFTVQHSGLSDDVQRTVLNLKTPIKELVNIVPPKPAVAAQNRVAPSNGAATTVSPKTTVTTSSASSGKGPVPFSGQDADTQRAEQRASRKATDAFNQLNETLGSKNVDTSNLSGTGKDIYKNTRIAMANEVVQGTFDSSKRNKMVNDAAAAIAASKTAPTSVQDWKERVSKADTASKQLMDTLESVHVDIDNLTKEQQEVIANAERQLRDDIISGTVTQDQTSDKIRELCNQVTSELTPPKDGAYVTIMNSSYQSQQQYKQDIKNKREELETSIDTTFDEMKTWLFDNRQIDTGKLTDAQKAEYYNTQRDIRNRLANGSLTKEESVQMYSILANRLSSTVYQYEYRNAYGKKVIGTISTDELIDPEDNSTGAQLARYALGLYGLEYEKKAVLNPGDPIFKQVDKVIDCSGLVNYSAFRISTELAKKVGNGARNQIVNTKEGEVWRKTTEDAVPEIEDLETGDLLYWADENNNIVHTAIYLRDGLMVESGKGGVKIAEIRFTTIDNDGSEHKLVQINRLD